MNKFNELKLEHDQLISDLQNGALTGDNACMAINDYLSDIIDSLDIITGTWDATIEAKVGDKNGTEKI